jgi:Periplasmic binding protein domain
MSDSWRRALPKAWCVGVLALAAVGMAACGSSSSSSSASSGGSAGGGSSSNAAQTSPGELSPAQKQVAIARLLARPTSIGITVPVGKPIPKGKKIAYISNLNVSGKIVYQSLSTAAGLLGWTVQEINPTGNTASAYATAMTAALQAKPDAIAMESLPVTAFAGSMAAAKRQGVAVICVACSDSPADVPGLTAAPIGEPFLERQANALGQLMGLNVSSGSTIGELNINYIPVQGIQAAEKQGILATCPTCKYQALNIPPAQLNLASAQAVNFIRRVQPAAFYNVTESLTTGLDTKLKASGVDPSTIKGYGGDLNTAGGGLQRLHNGQNLLVGGWIFPDYELGWYVADAAARSFAGVSVAPSDVAPQPWLVTKATAPLTSEPPVADYQEQFKKLWGIG